MTDGEQIQSVQALRECMSVLDMCLNSSDTAGALEEADRVLVQMMVLGREYPGLEKVFEGDEYRIYRMSAP